MERSIFKILSKEKQEIYVVFLPTYSPDLNPIEFVWKSVKRLISEVSIESVENLKSFVKENALNLFKKSSYAKGWFKKFSSIFHKNFNHNFCNLLVE